MRPFYARAFGIPLESVRALGVPRTDLLLDDRRRAAAKEALLSRCPSLRDKTVYLYAPTFRESGGTVQPFDPKLDFAALDASLRDDEVLAVTRHPVMKTPFFAPGAYAHVCDLTAEPTGDLLCAADVLLTDYSSVLFDASLLGVPTVFYCPDRRTYERSFYLDLDRDLPGPLTESADDVLPLLRQVREAPPAERIRAFCARQTAACDGRSTARVAALIRAYLE